MTHTAHLYYRGWVLPTAPTSSDYRPSYRIDFHSETVVVLSDVVNPRDLANPPTTLVVVHKEHQLASATISGPNGSQELALDVVEIFMGGVSHRPTLKKVVGAFEIESLSALLECGENRHRLVTLQVGSNDYKTIEAFRLPTDQWLAGAVEIEFSELTDYYDYRLAIEGPPPLPRAWVERLTQPQSIAELVGATGIG